MDNKMAIKFLAKNNYLLVDVFEEEQQETTVALPEDYKKQSNPFKIGQILNAEKDNKFYDYIGEYVLFPSNVVEEISVHGLNVKMIPSIAVYGILSKEENVSVETVTQ